MAIRIGDLIKQDAFTCLRSEVNEFAEELLDGYTDSLGDTFLYAGEKEIFDAIWGPVKFNAGEIAILDSPLIQRLRKIKQLGLASYVYCGADYSRFAHTIGVFYVANEMAQIIKRQLHNIADSKYDFTQIVRLAALFHDSGHMYYSHVSELFFAENTEFSRSTEIKKVITDFSVAINKRASLHEIISAILVFSPAVQRLLNKVSSALDGSLIKNGQDMQNILEYVACLIVGQANDEYLAPFYQIINGPIDADRCDYLRRDSHATNVPVAVDIFRLIHKLSVDMDKPPESLTDTEIWNGDVNTPIYYPTIAFSAIEALSQLIMARSIMYNSVYYHQKVRTAETMFRGVMEEFSRLKLPVVTNFKDILMATDDVFGWNCSYIVGQYVPEEKQPELREAVKKLNNITMRRYLKRSCAISMRYLCGEESDIHLFYKDILRPGEKDKINKVELETEVQYKKICGQLEVEIAGQPMFMIMEFPNKNYGNSIPNAIISYGPGQTETASDVFQTETWIESKDANNKKLYLLSDCEHRDLAFLAVQKVIYDRYQVYLSEEASVYSKVPKTDMNKRKRELLEKGYYEDSLYIASDLILESFAKDIRDVYHKYQTFEGAKGSKITEERILKYLKQFLLLKLSKQECASLIDGIMRMLKEALYINRKYFGSSMKTIFENKALSKNTIHLCPLGGEKDSAFHMMYYFNDVSGEIKNLEIHKSLQEALRSSRSSDNIVLFDDGAYSGTQIRSIIQEYMDVDKTRRVTDEIHVKPLTATERKRLGSRVIYIAYICFNTENKELIVAAANEAGMKVSDILYMFDMKSKIFSEKSSIFANQVQKELVQKSLEEIGYEILKSAKSEKGVLKPNWSEERVRNGALGYNDAQQTVILKSSVPTYSLTPLWLTGGKFKNREWMPLFARTVK